MADGASELLEPLKTARIDLLDVIEGISALFHEHHDAIVRWSWKLFCAKWARMLDQGSIRAKEQRDRERKQREQQQMDGLQSYQGRGYNSDY